MKKKKIIIYNWVEISTKYVDGNYLEFLYVHHNFYYTTISGTYSPRKKDLSVYKIEDANIYCFR